MVEMLSDHNLTISFISELEVLAYPSISVQEQMLIKDFLALCSIVDMNAKIKQLIIELRKKYRLKLPDAIIAATAIYANLPLVTADKQFGKVTELNIILYEW